MFLTVAENNQNYGRLPDEDRPRR